MILRVSRLAWTIFKRNFRQTLLGYKWKRDFKIAPHTIEVQANVVNLSGICDDLKIGVINPCPLSRDR